jgi:hypothetical protein
MHSCPVEQLCILFLEKIGMGTGINKGECKHIVFDEIDEQPVRLDVAFVESRIVTLEDMILILLVESFTLTQIIYDIIEKS